jgi:hypothetical protein
MDKEDENLPERKDLDAAADPTDAQRSALLCRSEAHRRNPGAAVPLEDALQAIDQSLGPFPEADYGPKLDPDKPQS